VRQTEGFAGEKFGGAYFFKLVQDAGSVRVVEQQQFDHRLYLFLNQVGFFQSFVGVIGVGRMVSHAFLMGRIVLVMRHFMAGFAPATVKPVSEWCISCKP
jgi:hypothetical protein